MAYETKNFEKLLGTKGLSDALLKNHFTLYDGYVKNINKIIDKLNAMIKDAKTVEPEFAELKRRFGWEFNGMRLHELYFSNMRKDSKPIEEKSKAYDMIIKDFKSFESFKQDFKSTGAIRGIGWVMLYHDKESGKLFNTWINEHDTGHLSGCSPLLIMDVFEHAFMIDYGVKRADYIEAFFSNIDWDAVEARMKDI